MVLETYTVTFDDGCMIGGLNKAEAASVSEHRGGVFDVTVQHHMAMYYWGDTTRYATCTMTASLN